MEKEPASGRPKQHDPLAGLVRRVALGDEDALRELYDQTSPRVFGLALQILRDRTAAEEAVIEVFNQVWRQAGRHDPAKGCVATWIATLARTRAIDLRRSRRRHHERSVPLDVGEFDLADHALPMPCAGVEREDRTLLVQQALATLPKEQRRALAAAYFDGLSHSEIAQLFGTPLGTIKTRIRTGLLALRGALADAEGEVA
jgi:RNA polymerase sigma-70 factor, ECF subfamily